MISRTYIVLMPSSDATNMEMGIQDNVGTKATPRGTGTLAANAGNGAWYEIQGRPVRFPNEELLSDGTANPAFIPRGRYGWSLSIMRYNDDATPDVPAVLLSNSIVGNLDAGGIIDVTQVADGSTGPHITLLNSANLVGRYFIVHFSLMEPKDLDRSPNGSV